MYSGSGRKPILLRLKGGGDKPLPVVGVCKEAKNANVHVYVFCNSLAASCRPAATPPQPGVLRPPGLSFYIQQIVLRSTASKDETFAR
jgi:hypothetical protein